jgi:hypothetical protein
MNSTLFSTSVDAGARTYALYAYAREWASLREEHEALTLHTSTGTMRVSAEEVRELSFEEFSVMILGA